MSKKGISKSDKIKLKFEAIWKAREIEMESFSARALYIWGFLTLCYGAYAFLLYQAISIFLFRKPCELSHPTGIFNTFNGLFFSFKVIQVTFAFTIAASEVLYAFSFC